MNREERRAGLQKQYRGKADARRHGYQQGFIAGWVELLNRWKDRHPEDAEELEEMTGELVKEMK